MLFFNAPSSDLYRNVPLSPRPGPAYGPWQTGRMKKRVTRKPETGISEQTQWMLAVRDARDTAAFTGLFDHFAPRLRGVALRRARRPLSKELPASPGPGIANQDLGHSPRTETGAPCICLAATGAGLRFNSRWPRLLQPFFRI